MRRCARVVTVVVAGVVLVGGTSAPAAAGGPTITKGGGTETFFDDFLFDLCGIPTETTLTEKWTHKQFADGSETLQVVRTFVPADSPFPIEKAAGTSFTAPDGSRRVVGKPIQLIDRPGGVRLLDAGWVLFDPEGNIVEMRGPHPFLSADLVEAYCP
jgi:hypothetical protein